MVGQKIRAKYLPTIGVECHVQLKTKTKLFAAVDNDSREAPPNTHISHICVGMPGALPVLNEAAIELCARAALALNTRPQSFSRFERKHYFYPDLPKGYQITQLEHSIIKGGEVELTIDGKPQSIGIERANLEEDAGKNIHPAGADYSLVDLNRAGTPLLEIVSLPELHSAEAAKIYARELWLLMKYADVTDGDLYHGHVRFDVNISVSADAKKLGTRSEIKNLNSFRSVEAAVACEIERQTELLEKGEKVVQETRGWDEAKQKTVSQRGKEEAEDYRYMPEPDVPPVELDAAYIGRVKAKMPALPKEIRAKLASLKIDPNVIEDILDRPELVPVILEALDKASGESARGVAFRLLEVPPEALNTEALKADDHLIISAMVEAGELSSTAAKQLTREYLKKPRDPRALAKEMNLIQMSDEGELDKIVAEVLAENPKVVEQIKAGETKAIGFLVGQVMAKSQGQANPSLAQKLIKHQLGI